MNSIKEYNLHKDDYSKLHFELKRSANHCQKNVKHCYKAHQHSFYQLIWFQSKGSHFVDYQLIHHEANTLFFLNKKQVHYFCDDVENNGFLFHFDDFFLSKRSPLIDQTQLRLFNEIGVPYVKIPEHKINEFRFLTEEINQELENKHPRYEEQIYHLLNTILVKTERLNEEQNPIEIKDGNFEIALNFKQFVDINLDQTISIDTISQELGVNAKKLSQISKSYFGKTPLQFIHDRKILEAKRLLANLNLNIQEVAYQLGFNQPTYFTKYFKKSTGITPREFISSLP